MALASSIDAPTPLAIGEAFRDLPLTRAHLKSSLALFIAFVIDAWEMMIIVYASPAIAREFPMTPIEMGSVIGAMFVGMMLGSLGWSFVADRIGRKTTILWSLAGYSLLSLASAFSPDLATLYVLRLLAGIAAAGMLITTFPLFEELLPVKHRGRFTVYLAAGWPLGMMLALGLSILLDPFGWRWILGVSSLAGLWLLVIAWWVPESPYWLAAVGRQDQARRVIDRLGAGVYRLPTAARLVHETMARAPVLAIFGRPLRWITLLQFALNFAYAWGFWGLQTWMPTLLQQRGLDVPQSNGFIIFTACSMIPGYLAAASLTGRFGRKRVTVVFVAISALAGFGFAAVQSIAALYVCTFLLSFFSLGGWGVWDTWLAELYPTANRSAGYGFGVFSQRIANTVAPTLTGAFIAHASSFGMTVGFIDLFLVATVILALCLPETEGHALN
jgi:MFS transporter, putative metabolite:H+ symporter